MACPEFATLHNGAKMPLLGYGTWQAKEGELEVALEAALNAGYRHIDTAFLYENEDAIGKVLQEKWFKTGKLKREDLFIVTKLPSIGLYPSGPEEYLTKSLGALRLDYVDMYLVHSPFSSSAFGPSLTDIDHNAIWKGMEAQVKAGRAKAIGLSNFNKRQIQNVLDHCTIRPANLQIELHVYMQQKPLVEFCRENGIVVTAYSPIGSPGAPLFFKDRLGVDLKVPDLVKNPVVLEVAKKHKRQSGQVLLKHIVQKGIVTIPKSTNEERIKQNISLFDFKLDDADGAKLDALDMGKNGRIFDFAPKGIGKDHREYPFHDYP